MEGDLDEATCVVETAAVEEYVAGELALGAWEMAAGLTRFNPACMHIMYMCTVCHNLYA